MVKLAVNRLNNECRVRGSHFTNIISACISKNQNLVCLKKSATDKIAVHSNFLMASKSILSPVIR